MVMAFGDLTAGKISNPITPMVAAAAPQGNECGGNIATAIPEIQDFNATVDTSKVASATKQPYQGVSLDIGASENIACSTSSGGSSTGSATSTGTVS